MPDQLSISTPIRKNQSITRIHLKLVQLYFEAT